VHHWCFRYWRGSQPPQSSYKQAAANLIITTGYSTPTSTAISSSNSRSDLGVTQQLPLVALCAPLGCIELVVLSLLPAILPKSYRQSCPYSFPALVPATIPLPCVTWLKVPLMDELLIPGQPVDVVWTHPMLPSNPPSHQAPHQDPPCHI
jgi:hypothetical protein